MGLVAIASSNGITIDGRLDTPGSFYIYYFDESREFTLIERRLQPQHPQCRHRYLLPQAAVLLLADVQVVLVTFVPRPTEIFFLTRGIMVIAVRGQVIDALNAYKQRGWLLESLIESLRHHSRVLLRTDEQEHGV